MSQSSLVEVDFKHNGERLLRMITAQYPNYHPLMSIVKIAHDAEAMLSEEGLPAPNLSLALRAHETVLKYVEPELKSVDVKIEKKDTRTINVRLFEEVKDVVPVEKKLEDGGVERRLLNDMVNSIIDVEPTE